MRPLRPSRVPGVVGCANKNKTVGPNRIIIKFVAHPVVICVAVVVVDYAYPHDFHEEHGVDQQNNDDRRLIYPVVHVRGH